MTIIYPVPEIFPDNRARFIQIVNTCHALAKKGIKVILISGIKRGYSKEEVLGFYGIPKHSNLKIIRLPILRREHSSYFRFSWHGIFNFFLFLHLLLRKLYSETQTVLFLRHIKLADFVLKLRKFLNIPVIFEVHEIFHLSTLNKRKREKIRELEYRVYNKADAIVCISQSIKKYLANTGMRQEFVHVIHDAVKKEWFNIKNRASSGSYICYTGNLYPWKGIDTLISAMKYLPDETLVIVGGGNRLDELKNMAKTVGVANRVKFIGAVSHSSVAEYLSQAKIAVLPNISDGPSQFSSPLKLFEYMACGLPIVASDLPVFREILIDKNNAVLFEPGNPKALAMRIKELTANPELAARLASTARKKAENYTYEKRARRISDVVKTISIKR